MRYSSVCLLAALLGSAALAQEPGPMQLTDPKSGVSVTLPKDWVMASGERGILATNSAKTAMVVLADVAQKFGDGKPEVEGSIGKARLRDVKIDRAAMVGEADRGAVEALIEVEGSGINPENEQVQFVAYIAKAGEQAGLALGAWKDAAQKSTVAGILDSIQVRKPAKSDGALVLSDASTGASVTIPAGWSAMAGRKGLLAANADRTAMTLIMRPQDNFDAAVKKVKTILGERVFDDVEIGEFDQVKVADAAAGTQLGQVVGASGKAKDRADQKPVDFKVLAVRRPEQDRGALILGAWKNEAGKAQVQKLLDSIHVAKDAKTEKPPEKKDKGDGK